MRISDWSSDVCSSDLVIDAFEGAAMIAIAQQGDATAEEGKKLSAHAVALANEAEANLQKPVEAKQSNTERLAGEIGAVYAQVKTSSLVLTARGVLLAILLGVFITRCMTRPLWGAPAAMATEADT